LQLEIPTLIPSCGFKKAIVPVAASAAPVRHQRFQQVVKRLTVVRMDQVDQLMGNHIVNARGGWSGLRDILPLGVQLPQRRGIDRNIGNGGRHPIFTKRAAITVNRSAIRVLPLIIWVNQEADYFCGKAFF
jgi:hypothetical protein